jgi:GTP-binding protein
MFIDQREIEVRGGDGGDGIVSWRREARVARGGPAGGDGGDGGSVVLLADPQLTTFGDLEDLRRVEAQHGGRGGPSNRHGASGEDRVFRVPPGTSVYDAESGRLLADLAQEGERWVAARGGAGGGGNASFATATDRAPRRADPGVPGERRRLRLELRLLADVGLVGLPNAGKSTLLSRVSAARPKVADYPFTTLAPHLGIAELPGERRLVLADLPGLVEGAHEGHGLGDRFLRHVERTRVLLHLVDLAPLDGSDPVESWRTVRAELAAYGRGLAERPEVLAATKADVWGGTAEGREALRRLEAAADREVHPVSAVTGTGLGDLLEAVARVLARAPPPPAVPDRLP